MKILGFRGDESRGIEIKTILQRLGGYNAAGLRFTEKRYLYYFTDNKDNFFHNNLIKFDVVEDINVDNFVIFTVDEFKEKFIFNVGDLVRLGEYGEIYTITKMKWDFILGEVVYEVNGGWYRHYDLVIPCEKKRITQEVPKSTRLIDNLEVVEVRGNEVEIVLDYCDSVSVEEGIIRIIRTSKYPKTYKECCSVMGVHPDNYISIRNWYCDDGEEDTTNYEQDILDIFDYLWKLRICRDTYWKIAGEEMGLSKPWEPTMETVYCISRNDNVIKCSYRGGKSNILEFPTEEMRDAFYENFKDLIENCKELL